MRAITRARYLPVLALAGVIPYERKVMDCLCRNGEALLRSHPPRGRASLEAMSRYVLRYARRLTSA